MPNTAWREHIQDLRLLKQMLCDAANTNLNRLYTTKPTYSNRFFIRAKDLLQQTERHQTIQLFSIASEINETDANSSLKLVALCKALFNPTLCNEIKNLFVSKALKNCVANLLIRGDFSRLKGVETNTLQSEVFSQYILKESIAYCTNCDSDEIIYDKLNAIKYILTLINDKIELDPTAKKLFDNYYSEYSSRLSKEPDIPEATIVDPNQLGYRN